jgi:hypothetical protein
METTTYFNGNNFENLENLYVSYLESDVFKQNKFNPNLQNDLVAYRKVVKWAKSIRKRIENKLQKCNQPEKMSETINIETDELTSTPLKLQDQNECCRNKESIENQSQQSIDKKKTVLPTYQTQDDYVRMTQQAINKNGSRGEKFKRKIKDKQVVQQLDVNKVEDFIKNVITEKFSKFNSRLDYLEDSGVKLEGKIRSFKTNLKVLEKDISNVETCVKKFDLDLAEKNEETNKQLHTIIGIILNDKKN